MFTPSTPQLYFIKVGCKEVPIKRHVSIIVALRTAKSLIGLGPHTKWLVFVTVQLHNSAHVIGIIFPFDRTAPVSSNSAGQTVQSTAEPDIPSQSNMSLLISSPFGCQWIQIGGMLLIILHVIIIHECINWFTSFVRCSRSNSFGKLCSIKS